jgi:hypothetical protein
MDEVIGGAAAEAEAAVGICAEAAAGPSSKRVASEQGFLQAEQFTYAAMKRNINSRTADTIRVLNSTTVSVLGVPIGIPEVLGYPGPTAAALAIWANKVKPHGDWDYKDILLRTLPPGYDYKYAVPGTPYKVFYDIWANIHYGYVGRSVKFSRLELNEGQKLPGAGHTDEGDLLTTGAGMDMWEAYGSGLTPSEFAASVYLLINQMANQNVRQVSKYDK